MSKCPADGQSCVFTWMLLHSVTEIHNVINQKFWGELKVIQLPLQITMGKVVEVWHKLLITTKSKELGICASLP